MEAPRLGKGNGHKWEQAIVIWMDMSAAKRHNETVPHQHASLTGEGDFKCPAWTLQMMEPQQRALRCPQQIIHIRQKDQRKTSWQANWKGTETTWRGIYDMDVGGKRALCTHTTWSQLPTRASHVSLCNPCLSIFAAWGYIELGFTHGYLWGGIRFKI